MSTTLIVNATAVNQGKIFCTDVLVKGHYIHKIGQDLSSHYADSIIDAQGKYLLPGVIDDQVHFREPGLTHKANIYSEAKAAVAGGVTAYMEMPNTLPPTLTQELLEEKYQIAAKTSLANYSFYMGTSNDNLDEVLRTDPKQVCGIKVFMGSSTGNMLVDNTKTLAQLFSQSPLRIATHCEDEQIIKKNTEKFRKQYGNAVPMRCHPQIRSETACYASSSLSVALAKQHNTRLHILHISTEKELELFTNTLPLKNKKITAEACIHHLWFDDTYYDALGTHIKWNPAVKSAQDQTAIFEAVCKDKIDIIATDHAPHTRDEKNNNYWKAPSGGPLVQHSLVAMLEFYHQGKISLEKIVEKMCHNPAIVFQIKQRGYIREGYFADLVLVDLHNPWQVTPKNIYTKCRWSPFEEQIFQSKVTHALVSGHVAYANGKFDESVKGQRLLFEST